MFRPPFHQLVAIGLLLPAFAHAGTVSVPTPDGSRISGTLEGSGDTAFLLVHGEGESAARLSTLQENLVRAGFQALAIDLRGHGKDTRTLDEQAWAAMDDDVDAALDWLANRRGVDRVVVVGVGLGAPLVMAAATDQPEVVDAILATPAISSHGHSLVAPLKAWRERPMLVLVGADDETGRRTAGAIASQVSGRHAVEVVSTGGRGAALFEGGPRAAQTALAWVQTTLDKPPTAEAVSAGDIEEVETSGKRFGE